MIVGEKNRAQNCLTVSNLKLDDVFSDVFGKSSRSITKHILAHPGEFFDVIPYVYRRCKTPVEEIQAAFDEAISPEQAIKLQQCLDHIDELEVHIEKVTQEKQKFKMTHAKSHIDFINESISEIEAELFLRSRQYDDQIKRIATVTGITELSTLFILSEIGTDMSVFESDRHLCS